MKSNPTTVICSPLHTVVFKHLLHVLVLKSFRVKYSNTLDPVAISILTVLPAS